jgi:hypothetical protein
MGMVIQDDSKERLLFYEEVLGLIRARDDIVETRQCRVLAVSRACWISDRKSITRAIYSTNVKYEFFLLHF